VIEEVYNEVFKVISLRLVFHDKWRKKTSFPIYLFNSEQKRKDKKEKEERDLWGLYYPPYIS
jgi:hypothetical protein